MKLLFCHSDPAVLQRLVDRPRAGKNIVIPCLDPNDLVRVVASTEPHLVVIGAGRLVSDPTEFEQRLIEAGFDIPIRLLLQPRPTDRQLDELWGALEPSVLKRLSVDWDSQDYAVLMEEDSPRSIPSAAADRGDLKWQENRFLALLENGSPYHNRAKEYFGAAQQTEAQCGCDWVAGALSEEPAAYLWRTQLFRYVSVLAHYVPGVEVECLPLPHPPSPKLDFLNRGLSGEAFYALSAVRAFGIEPGWNEGLWVVGQLLVTREPRLREECARLAGWSTFLRAIAESHLRVAGALLANDPVGWAELGKTRQSRNLIRVFGNWWNLGDIATLETLARLSAEFHAGRRAEGVSKFDSFYEFAERIQQSIKEASGLN